MVIQLTGMEAVSAVSIVTLIVIPTFLLRSREIKNYLLYPFVVIGTWVIGVSTTFLFSFILKIPEQFIVDRNWYTILCQILQSIALVILVGYRKVKIKESYQINLDWYQYMLFYIVVMLSFFLLAPIKGLRQKYGCDYTLNMVSLFISIACIVLLVLIIWHGIIVNRVIILKKKNKNKEEYIKLQKEHYKNLLDQDEKMRRFRHDLNAHITIIKSHCQNEEYKKLENYLECIVEESAISLVESYTGNKGVDALLRQLFERAKIRQIKVDFQGALPEKNRVNDYDLCTILSNLIINAIEACDKIHEISEKNIKIIIQTYDDQIYIVVKNTFAENAIVYHNYLVTSKDDVKNHGLGSGNVKNTVKKYNGILEYKLNSKWFIAEIII